MLVLSRKKNETIVINNDITVSVVEIRDDKVRLGVVAPKEVPVYRLEVWESIHGYAHHVKGKIEQMQAKDQAEKGVQKKPYEEPVLSGPHAPELVSAG